ncbi:hypothetical protein IFM89_016120 [Coptis chinensis]|uniref:Uncharacterized protein n=1 Tax=Coptis chinensis TaxID=261450 RepID=A0A835GXQ7_9MAGN|nr:hypothetical protein IFM89_016120 [Coptis chinensis]
MRKRERENPCGVCGHYHKYEEGEVCSICGHRAPEKSSASGGIIHMSAFPSEIFPDFLYLGSYDNASRAELLKAQGISHILNTVPACQNLYRNSFTYHCVQEENALTFDDAIQFLDQCEKDKARVLVHCMTGKSRSPAIVVAFLMKSRGWRLAQSYQWVKEKRPSVDLSPAFELLGQDAVNQQLQEYEQKIFGSAESCHIPVGSVSSAPFGYGFQKADDTNPVPAFGNLTTNSIFDQAALNIPPQDFTFGATRYDKISNNPNDAQMES